jgi:hypothetical protein
MNYFKLALFFLSLGQLLFNYLAKKNAISEEQRRAYLQTLQDCAAAAKTKEEVIKDVAKKTEQQVDADLSGDFRDGP